MSDLVDNKPKVEDDDEDFHEVPDSEKTPVTIVTGFLGSGKTTLVNYILKEQNTWKICVVENEFGEVSIDNDLVRENLAAKEDIIMLDNGCVCCSVRGDLVRTFAMLASRRKDFDAIIIETTGLADPSPIIFTFNSNALIQDNYRIDSVVCLVDAKHVNIHLDETRPDGNVNEAEQQIAFCDLILLNKTDLVTADELEDVEDRIKSINAFATLLKTKQSRAPLEKILNLNTFSLERVVNIDPSIMDEDEEEHDHGHVHDEHCSHDHASGHVHDEHCNHGHVHDEHCSHGHSSEHHETGHDHGHGHGHHDEACKQPHHDAGHVHDEHCDHKDHDHHDHHGHHDEACKHPHHDAGHVHDEHCDHKEHSEHKHGHDHAHGHAHGGEEAPKKKKKRVHNLSLVSSVGFTIVGLLDVALFNAFMSSLLQAKAADLYRTKGVLAFANQGDTKFVFQGVHEQINFGPSDKPFEADEPRESKMVFIGKNIDYDFLNAQLLACCEDPTTAKITMHKR